MIALALSLLFFSAQAADGPLVGNWKYVARIYQEREVPSDGDLQLFYEFTESGESRLRWHYAISLGDTCERTGRWRIEGSDIVDEVVWVNPENTLGCGRDPDMQRGKVSVIPFEIDAQGRLLIELHLADEPLHYVWERQP